MEADNMKIAILVNLDANNKNARKKWLGIKKEVLKRMPLATEVIEYHLPFDIKQCLEDQIIQKKVNCIISAGGDGSGNIILNHIKQLPDDKISNLSVGFIGLGSSNDLLKPYKNWIGDIPVRISTNKPIKVDLGIASFIDEKGLSKKRYFLANSSIGVGASANNLFNRGNFVIRFLKSRWTNLAILYTIIKSIIEFRNYPVEIQYHGKTKHLLISHLSVIKNPHISGDLKFDQEIAPDDGKLGLNICEDMSKLELIQVMNDLKKGVFSGKKKRLSCYIKDLWIKPNEIIPVELDGEIEMVQEISFSIAPRCIKVLQ